MHIRRLIYGKYSPYVISVILGCIFFCIVFSFMHFFAKLFKILENELQTKTWWEAWVPVVVVFSIAEIIQYHPLASMQLILEFGHDTDSYAEVMGAFMGAIHWKEIFPKEMRDTVNKRMKEQFGQNVNDWMELIKKYNQ